MEDYIVDWSRAQFALTAIYHWLFVPLTLGLGFIVAIMETIYVKTNDEFWKKTTKFWMTLFAINFAIGVATGIIMEFEFGTNWANYSWFVGDIFGAPLAIEGILAFFMESAFFALMFFGWDKVSKNIHLLSTWLVAVGSNLSALWILVANAWMQEPIGMKFNPDTVRNEMVNFWDILFSPTAISKFLHVILNGYVLSSVFVIGVCAWYLLKNKNLLFAKRSMIVGSVLGIVSSIFLMLTGDMSGIEVTKTQPIKLAAMEGLYDGEKAAGLVALGIVNPEKKVNNDEKPFLFEIKIPYLLSLISKHELNAYVPGIKDLVYGNKEYNIESVDEKIVKGKMAIDALKKYKISKQINDKEEMKKNLLILNDNIKYFGYGQLKAPEDVVPPVALTFYAFHIMVALAGWFLLLFILVLFFIFKNNIEKQNILLKLGIATIPLAYIASEAGWIVAEVGRQPWIIQDLMLTNIGVTNISSVNVQITFYLFAILFTILLIAEIKIMLKQISIGPKGV